MADMIAKVGYLVIDAVDVEHVARFWCELLGMQADLTVGDGQFVVLSPRDGGLSLVVQRVAEPKPGKNRLHLDLIVDELDEATSDVERLGGVWLEPRLTRELEGYRWRTMADLEGNEFDLQVAPAA